MLRKLDEILDNLVILFQKSVIHFRLYDKIIYDKLV